MGSSVRRKEDYRFLTGQGNYTDDINRPNQTYAYILRAREAHAKITIKTDKAKKAAGVVAIFTGDDMQVGHWIGWWRTVINCYPTSMRRQITGRI